MKVLAVDYGEVRVGLALGDTESKLALPHGVLQRASDELLLVQLRQIVAEEDISCVVVGEPVALSGQASAQTGAVRQFAEALRAKLDLPVELADERLTSARAAVAAQSGSRRTRDELAAMFILQDYFDRLSAP